MKAIMFGALILAFAVILLSSPYWFLREFARPDDDPIPAWMGDARARKRRLVVILGVLTAIVGGFVLAFALAGGP